jgi:dTDP-glucose pyrophosphorylase/CBS domain-containing protein
MSDHPAERQAHRVGIPSDRINKTKIRYDIPIFEAIRTLDQNGIGILLVVDENSKLLGVVTDGNVRRAIIQGTDFNLPISEIAERNPVVAPEGLSKIQVLSIMDHSRRFLVNHVPVINEKGEVVDLYLRSDYAASKRNLSSPAVVMAGGFGKRLFPLTKECPKPMLPFAGKPIMQHIVEALVENGINKIYITTHYLASIISDHFGNGEQFKASIEYVHEEVPLGTAGSLSLLPRLGQPFFVVNGDVVTSIDYESMLDFHIKHGADITVAAGRFSYQVPFGVIHNSGEKVDRIEEKPSYDHFVNAGVYLLNPEVVSRIPSGTFYHMTDLISDCLNESLQICWYPILGNWLDVGLPENYFISSPEKSG